MSLHQRTPIPSSDVIRNLPPDGGPEFNRLVFEQSPYLLQHAGNPVDWYAWGEAAFDRARKENKPVFLSVGYSTCHWCHVMERESFEDEEVADLLNRYFVCVKVDREERPDVDKVYMDVTQAMTGSGGWPMTVVMTPEKVPFFAGTYFPKESRYGRIGMLDLLPQLHDAWINRRSQVDEVGAQIRGVLAQMNAGAAGGALSEDVLHLAYGQTAARYDAREGGFGSAPKFPMPHLLSFLLRYHHRTADPKALSMVTHTLTRMRLGGMYDHVGFGFHRYSTDAKWLLPHFEKMLYDQALCALAYLEAYQVGGDPLHAQTAREIIEYVLRDLASPEGGFYSAEDADSEGVEGKFYLWTPEEVIEVLGPDDGGFFNRLFNIVPGGNFEDQATGKRTGESIPHLQDTLDQLVARVGLNAQRTGSGEPVPPDVIARVESCRRRLFAAREKRIHPFKDDKVLTDWNGLMIAALARGSVVLKEDRYAAAAVKAADFVWRELRTPEGAFLKRYRQGHASLPGHLNDYAFMLWGLLELYEAQLESRYLQAAVEVADQLLSRFRDVEGGGLFLGAAGGELPVRAKEIYDGAIPSGNSVAALHLLRLADLTANPDLRGRGEEILQAFSGALAAHASAHPLAMQALDYALGPTMEVVLAGGNVDEMSEVVRNRFRPREVLLRVDGGLRGLAPFTEGMIGLDGNATAYVCRNFVCERPVTTPQELATLLRSK